MIGVWLLGLPASAQILRVPPYRTVAELGACVDGKPKLVAVTDGATDADCSTGGGTADVPCFCLDGAWEAGGTGAQGPAGDDGATGAGGATGPAGPAGATGPAPSGAANQVLATPNGSAGVASLRSIVAADIPTALPLVSVPSPFIALGGTTANDGGMSFPGFSIIRLRNGDNTGYAITDLERVRAFVGNTPMSVMGALGLELSPATEIAWSASMGDATQGKDTRITRAQAGIVAFEGASGTGGSGRLPPIASPPCTCGVAACEGVYYYDTSHALCVCGASTWHNQTPSDGGSCS